MEINISSDLPNFAVCHFHFFSFILVQLAFLHHLSLHLYIARFLTQLLFPKNIEKQNSL